MRRDLPAGRGKLWGLPAVTQHGSIWMCSRIPFQSIAPAQALLQRLGAGGPSSPVPLPSPPSRAQRGLQEKRLAHRSSCCSGLVLSLLHPCSWILAPQCLSLLYVFGVNQAALPAALPTPAAGVSCQEGGHSSSPCPPPRGGSSKHPSLQEPALSG